MRETLKALGTWATLVAGAVVLLGLARQGRESPTPTPLRCPDGRCRPVPTPPRPPPVPRPWGPRDVPVRGAGAWVGGGRHPDGTEMQNPLPEALHLRNTGGSDGSGLCVFTSIAHAARWQNVPVLEDFRDWMRKHPGGGYPEKVDAMIARVCAERGIEKPAYIQIEGTDLDVLRLACKSGLLPAVTYGYSPSGRYGGRRIAHMVNLVHAGPRHFAVLDNNHIGSGQYEWLDAEEFRKVYTGGRQGWAVILLDPGPPPRPHNGEESDE